MALDDSYAKAIQAPLDWSDVNKDSKNNIQDEAIDNNSGRTGHEEGSGSVSVDSRFHEENVESKNTHLLILFPVLR